MRFDAAAHVASPGRTAAFLDILQMLSGAALVLFMWAHMLLVASVLLGPWAMDAIARFLEKSFLAQVGGPLIGLCFLLHFVLAARKIPVRSREQRIMLGHARMLRHADTWLWIVQALSGMIILLMGFAHMWLILSDLPVTAAKAAAQVQKMPWLLFYLLFLPLIQLHMYAGLYRIGVKWGFIHRRERPQCKRIMYVLILLFTGIGLATILRFLTLPLGVQ